MPCQGMQVPLHLKNAGSLLPVWTVRGYYLHMLPPSSTSVCPVMYVACVHTHTAASATSSARAMRPIG